MTKNEDLTPPKFNSLPLKNDGWKMSFLLRLPIFRGYVKFPGCSWMVGGAKFPWTFLVILSYPSGIRLPSF